MRLIIMLIKIILCKDVCNFDPSEETILLHRDSKRGRLFGTKEIEDIYLSDMHISTKGGKLKTLL